MAENKPLTQKDAILYRLALTPNTYVAVHEFDIHEVSANSIASRLPELALAGKVVSRRREGKPFKEWALAPSRGVAA